MLKCQPMYRQAAGFQNSTRHASFSAVLAERQKEYREPRYRKGKKGEARKRELAASGPTITFTKQEQREADLLLSDLRATVKAAKEARARRKG